MALFHTTFLLLLILISSLHYPSHGTTTDHRNETFQSMITKACNKINDQDTCLSAMQHHLQIYGDSHGLGSIIHAALLHAFEESKSAIEKLTGFTTLSINSREQIAMDDCRELLDFTVTELSWSLSEMNRINAGVETPHSDGNLKAWLSAALGNQDTCIEGFVGTDGRLERFMRGSLSQVTQLITNVLKLYTQMQNKVQHPYIPLTNATGGFPNWMPEGDKHLLRSKSYRLRTDAVVAVDGSGRYRSISEAISDAPSYSPRRYVIYVKKGVYKENIEMKKNKANIMLVGDGIGKTIITGDRNVRQGWTAYRTATFAVSGKGFIARDVTFRNTAGPENHQAVALRVDSDQSAFYRCSMEGYQDTLYAHSQRQFYRDCSISGTVDFICGRGAAVFQKCKIFTRQPLPQQKVTITAQSRNQSVPTSGFTIQDSFVYATRPTYLGRPWKPYSRTVFLNCYMSSMVQPEGWLEWNGNDALDTLWYGEYKNYGPGAATDGRVKWPGYHKITDAHIADSFTVRHFIDGLAWLPETGINFTAGLSN